MEKSEVFRRACGVVLESFRGGKGIGTLGEKTLHAVVKHYIDPSPENHEVRVGPFVADIVRDGMIFEIQTSGFNRLRKKLDHYAEGETVTIVYPIAHTKWIVWIDGETGEVTKRRKSPKVGTPYEIFYELYKIKQQLLNPGVRIKILMVDMEEYRNLNGWSHDKKRGASRHDRIPIGLKEELDITRREDYVKLIPEGMPERFSSADFQKAAKLSRKSAQLALNVLTHLGAVERIGKDGNSIIYTK